MHRFYVPNARAQGARLILDGSEAHHALHVLRLRGGERVTVLDGAGGVFDGEVAAVGRREVQLTVLEARIAPPLACELVLMPAVLKGKAMDWLVQKATELGARRILPFLGARSVVQVEAEDAIVKADKWRAIAIESIKQCGSPWLPRIEPPVELPALLKSPAPVELSFIGTLPPEGRPPREHLDRFRAAYQRAPRSVGVWIGPEGDFTPEEIAAIMAAGAMPVTLGPLVLRAETAAIYALSVFNAELLAGGR